MATSIPPHNLCESGRCGEGIHEESDKMTTEAADADHAEGPDFPTGGIVVNKDDLPADLPRADRGRSSCVDDVEVEELKGGKKQLVITEIPYTMIGARHWKILK